MAEPFRLNALGQPVGLPVPDRFPRPLPPHEPLAGRDMTLTPLRPAHAEGLFTAFAADTDSRGWTYLPVEPFKSPADARTWTERAAQSRDPLFYTVLDNRGAAVGVCAYLRIAPDTGVIEVGHIHFSPALQATRGATEAMAAMMAHVFDDLGYRRYEWKCDALNAPSRRAAVRLGFTYEGTFRQATHYKGRNRDTAWYAILDSEWPAQKARFDRWLDPANFDASGRQKTSLDRT